jgi:KDO2-lipid IV(A) lauroyltransferase
MGRLARAFDVPVYGLRVVRLPRSRFWVEVTPPLELPRDAEGRVDADGTTALVTKVIEGWVREHPDQWFWVYDRWKGAEPKRPRRRRTPGAAA